MQPVWITLAILGSVFTGLLLLFFLKKKKRDRRRAVLMAARLSKEQIAALIKFLPLYHRLPEDLKQQLHGLVNIFLNEKTFVGCGGLEITDEMKVTIAGQACILLLNRKTHFYPKLKTIYVYPHTYVANQRKNDRGLIVEGKSVRLGESWQNGPVVLTWDSITGGARNVQDGQNVVLHEFAHQLDQEDGDADGAPILDNAGCYRSWAAVLGTEYERLRKKERGRRRSVLNKYGATNPAEFFAVATEAFFEKPKQMHKRSPELYDELKRYYKLNPLEWTNDH